MNVIIVPPAVGLPKAFDEELDLLRREGHTVFVFRPTDAFAKRDGLSFPWQEVCYLSAMADDLVRFTQSACKEPPALVGFNLGGTIAALAARAHACTLLIASGSVPRLSYFWPNAEHSVAAAARSRAHCVNPAFAEILEPFDLVSSIHALTCPVLLQFGWKDDWILDGEASDLSPGAAGNIVTAWYEDDHEMMGGSARNARLDFLRLAQSGLLNS